MNLKILASNIYCPARINFKGCDETTTLEVFGANKDAVCVNETYFFRNPETLNFVSNYVDRTYKNGTNIADFACSTGEEAYSLAMLLAKNNKDKKYKITGYDIAPNIINSVDSRLYEITNNVMEKFLVYSAEDSQTKYFKNLFYQNFETFPKNLQAIDYTPHQIYKINKKIEKSSDVHEKILLKYMLEFAKVPAQKRWNDFSYPKKDAFKNVVSFEVKDISELGKTYKLDKNTGVVFFKNAFYHLTGYYTRTGFKGVDLSAAIDVVKQINKSLLSDGILVVGVLDRDHMPKDGTLSSVIQDGKEISVINNSPFHKMLKENGFEPIFYEQVRDILGNVVTSGEYLPSVWKKVRDV